MPSTSAAYTRYRPQIVSEQPATDVLASILLSSDPLPALVPEAQWQHGEGESFQKIVTDSGTSENGNDNARSVRHHGHTPLSTRTHAHETAGSVQFQNAAAMTDLQFVKLTAMTRTGEGVALLCMQ